MNLEQRVADRPLGDRLAGQAQTAETLAHPGDQFLTLSPRERLEVDAHAALRGRDLDQMGGDIGTSVEELRAGGTDGQ